MERPGRGTLRKTSAEVNGDNFAISSQLTYNWSLMVDDTVLAVTNLTKEYDSLRAADGITFSIGHGEIVGLLGPNGAGKTTTINMILGILLPTSGSIEMLGKNLSTHRSELAQQMNFSAVYSHLPANLSVSESLRIFGLLYEVPNLEQRIAEL